MLLTNGNQELKRSFGYVAEWRFRVLLLAGLADDGRLRRRLLAHRRTGRWRIDRWRIVRPGIESERRRVGKARHEQERYARHQSLAEKVHSHATRRMRNRGKTNQSRHAGLPTHNEP